MIYTVLSEIECESDRAFMLRLYERYKYLMLSIARKTVSDHSAAEDIMQEALLKLIPKASLLRGMEQQKMQSYIVYTVRNTAFNYLRYRSREQRYMTFVDISELYDVGGTPMRHVEQQAELTRRRKALYVSLRRLPEREQELLIRKYFLGQSDVEIGAALACKTASVRMMLTRCRRRVLEYLREEGVSYEIS